MAERGRAFGREFYGRQVVMKELGEKGQRKLAKSSVAVVGLGGLGTASSLYLALAGVGSLCLIDQDTVELGNLHRQILYTLDDLHYPKVEVAAERLRKANPTVEVQPVPENLNVANAEQLLSDVDCVVDGLDNMKTRYLVNRTCIKLGIPYVFGAAIGLEGNLSVFDPPRTPCLECVLPSVEDSSLLSCDVRGVLGATPGIVGTLQALETVKVLTGMDTTLKGKLLVCDFSDMYFATVDIVKRDSCLACGVKPVMPEGGERIAWLCGRKTVNINPAKPLQISLDEACRLLGKYFRVRVKSRFAVVFDYGGFEVSLFGGGRMLIKNVEDEKAALRVYEGVRRKLRAS